MITYTFGNGTVMQLDVAESYLAYQGDLAGHAYSYTLGSNDIKEQRMNPKEVTVPFTGTWVEFDRLLRNAESDVANKTPGTVTVKGWSKRAHVTGAAHKRSAKGRILTDLRIVLLDGLWWRLSTVSLLPGQGSTSESGLDYQFDYEHDYSQPATGGTVLTESLVPCKPRIVFYGPVTDPQVIIAGNKYKVTATVAAGARIEIDGRDKTVKLIAEDGTIVDKFASALRGSGENGGEYIFQPIPPGSHDIAWDDSFGVDVSWYEEVGEVPWSQS